MDDDMKDVFQRLTILETQHKDMYGKVVEMHEVLTKAKGAKYFLILLLGAYTFAISQAETVFRFFSK